VFFLLVMTIANRSKADTYQCRYTYIQAKFVKGGWGGNGGSAAAGQPYLGGRLSGEKVGSTSMVSRLVLPETMAVRGRPAEDRLGGAITSPSSHGPSPGTSKTPCSDDLTDHQVFGR
jgi:hypothetical protein